MADITITVPINSSIDKKKDFVVEVSTVLAGSNDVVFKDESGNPVNVPFIGLMNATDGAVKSRTVSGQPTTQKLANGGYHSIPVHKIYATGTDASLGIHVKLV